MRMTSWRAVRCTGSRIVLITGLVAVVTGTATMPAASASGNAGHARSAAGVTPKVRREGILALSGNGAAYDLDSRAASWGQTIGKAWTDQNIEYFPGRVPLLAIAGEPATDVLMGTRGHWTYQDCADANYDSSYTASNPNTAKGSALNVGHGICVVTQNTFEPGTKKPLKSDGGHFALLVVKARTSNTLTLRVTVWQ